MNKIWFILLAGFLVIDSIALEPDLYEKTDSNPNPEESSWNWSGEGNNSITRTQDTVSINYRDEEVGKVLQSVADQYGLNIFLPEHLDGRISIKLRDVSWRQVFDLVLNPMDYTWVEEGNIIKILRRRELLAEPYQTRVFIINYSNADEIQSALRPIIDSSEGGRIQVDTRSNALVITERPSKFGTIIDMIDRLDRPTDQVLIEAKIFEIVLTAFEGQDAVSQHETELFAEPSPLRVSQRRLVAHPMVVTLNQHEAEISINEKIPVQGRPSSESEGDPQNIVSEYHNIVGSLKVLPDVNSAGFIKLSIESEVTSFEGGFDLRSQHGGYTNPLTVTRRIVSEVVVKSGYSLMIGGFEIAEDSGAPDRELTEDGGGDSGRRSFVIILNAKVLNPDGATYRDVFDERLLHEFGLLDMDIPGFQIPQGLREKLDEIRLLRSESRYRSEIESLGDLIDQFKTESPTSSGRE